MKGAISRRWATTVVVPLVAIYVVNYFVTPTVVGEKLEVYFRPRFDQQFQSEEWKKADPALWKAGSHLPYGQRYEMVDDLLRSKILLGASEQKVIEVLGRPESVSEMRGEHGMYYFLANQRQYPARSIWFPGLFANQDCWMLEVRLRGGKVCETKVYFT